MKPIRRANIRTLTEVQRLSDTLVPKGRSWYQVPTGVWQPASPVPGAREGSAGVIHRYLVPEIDLTQPLLANEGGLNGLIQEQVDKFVDAASLSSEISRTRPSPFNVQPNPFAAFQVIAKSLTRYQDFIRWAETVAEGLQIFLPPSARAVFQIVNGGIGAAKFYLSAQGGNGEDDISGPDSDYSQRGAYPYVKDQVHLFLFNKVELPSETDFRPPIYARAAFVLQTTPLRLGRDPNFTENSVAPDWIGDAVEVDQSSDRIGIRDPGIIPDHAEIGYDAATDSYYVMSLVGKEYGDRTFVNGKPLRRGAKRILQGRERIRLGPEGKGVEFQFLTPEQWKNAGLDRVVRDQVDELLLPQEWPAVPEVSKTEPSVDQPVRAIPAERIPAQDVPAKQPPPDDERLSETPTVPGVPSFIAEEVREDEVPTEPVVQTTGPKVFVPPSGFEYRPEKPTVPGVDLSHDVAEEVRRQVKAGQAKKVTLPGSFDTAVTLRGGALAGGVALGLEEPVIPTSSGPRLQFKIGSAVIRVDQWKDGVMEIGSMIPGKEIFVDGRWNVTGDRAISQQHAKLILREGIVYVMDQKGSTGTWLNGDRIPSDVEIPLAKGDAVKMGKSEFVLDSKELPASSRFEIDISKIPDLQVVGNVDQGRDVESDVFIGSEGEKPADEFFHSDKIKFLAANGDVFVVDRRPPEKIEVKDDDIEDPTVAMDYEGLALLVNGEPLKRNEIRKLRNGDNLRHIYADLLVFMHRPIISALPGWLKRVLSVHSQESEGFGRIQKILREHAPGFPLTRQLEEVLTGKASVYGLPKEYGIAGMVNRYLGRESAALRAEGHTIDNSVINIDPSPPSRLQTDYLTRREIARLREGIHVADDIPMVVAFIENSSFVRIGDYKVDELVDQLKEIDDNEGNGLQFLPRTAGIRQKVRDLVEKKQWQRIQKMRVDKAIPLPEDPNSDLVDTYAGIDKAGRDLMQRAWMIQSLNGKSLSSQDRKGIEESIYQVLERGQLLKHVTREGGIRKRVRNHMRWVVDMAWTYFPKEMGVDRNPFTGEKVERHKAEKEDTLYRLAKVILNRHANRPAMGVPSKKEEEDVKGAVKNYLGVEVGDYNSAQEVIREVLDKGTPEATKLLALASPEERAAILAAFFGDYWHRDMQNDANAFRLAYRFGDVGLYREVGMTYLIQGEQMMPNVSLGDMSSVTYEQGDLFSLLHTHPVKYQDSEERIMGRPDPSDDSGEVTTALAIVDDDDVYTSSRSVLFSRHDIDYAVGRAKKYVRAGYPQKFGTTPLYDVHEHVYRGWVNYSFGGARVEVEMVVDGDVPVDEPARVSVTYAIKDESAVGNQFKDQIGRLREHIMKVHGLAASFKQVSYEEFKATLPFPVD